MKISPCFGLCATVLLWTLTVAQGRVGETVAQVEQRYAQPIGDPPPRLAKHYALADAVRVYRQSGLDICVAYLHGKSVAEFFVHRVNAPLSGPEINDLLMANRGEANASWKQLDLGTPPDGAVGWARSDGLLVASSNTDHKFLEILDHNFWDAVIKVEAHPLEGF